MLRKEIQTSALLFAATSIYTPGYAKASEVYSSLEDFCLQANADTPENYRCGQETADVLLTEEEQTIALNMMGQHERPSFDTIEAHDAFMDKLARVTAGCLNVITNRRYHRLAAP